MVPDTSEHSVMQTNASRSAEDFMDTLKKWLLSVDRTGELHIETRDVNAHIPLNRMLDVSGYYQLEAFQREDRRYLLVCKTEETHTFKSCILVSKIEKTETGSRLTDVDESDREDMEWLADVFMRSKRPVQ